MKMQLEDKALMMMQKWSSLLGLLSVEKKSVFRDTRNK